METALNNVAPLDFLKSAFSYRNCLHTTTEIIAWLQEQNASVFVDIKKIPFTGLQQWAFDKKKTMLTHQSGKFFSIEGINIKTNWGDVTDWDQPIINQPEIGYLGFITKEFNGILHFLVQGKIEPGNINCVQLSPTLQATKSNYTKIHLGKAPPYLQYFQGARPGQILLDQLQSEQGSRFLRKRNRNIIIKIDDEIQLLPNYIWATLAQIKQLMQYDNLVNMDTRTVVSCIPFYKSEGAMQTDLINRLYLKNESGINQKLLASILSRDSALYSFDELIRFITKLKCLFELDVKQVPLYALEDWNIGETEIYHKDHKYFNIIAVEVQISSREVQHWTQPMIEPVQQGICAFVCKEVNGLIHFAVQAKLECGNFDIIELAPTVQCLTGNYQNQQSRQSLPFLEYVLAAGKENIIFDSLQSEEGGRFFKEQNRNMLVLAGADIEQALPENFIWMTLNQIQTFIKFNNYFNIQARTLIAAISFTGDYETQ